MSSASRTQQLLRSSFDVDLTQVIRTALDNGVKPRGFVLLPILVLERAILADIDVLLADGQSLHVLKRGENAFLTQAAALSAAPRSVVKSEGSHHESYSSFDLVLDRARPKEVRELISPFQFALTVVLPVSDDEVSTARKGRGQFRLLKVRLKHAATKKNAPWTWHGPSWRPRARFEHSISRMPYDALSHVRIEIPEGLRAVRARFTGIGFKYDDSVSNGSIRVTPHNVVANARHEVELLGRAGDVAKAASLTGVEVICRISAGVILPVLLSLLAAAVFVAGLYQYELTRPVSLTDKSVQASFVALLVVIPPLIGLYVGRADAHFKVRAAVLVYRALLIVAALILMGLGLLIALSEQEALAWALPASALVLSGMSLYVGLGWLTVADWWSILGRTLRDVARRGLALITRSRSRSSQKRHRKRSATG